MVLTPENKIQFKTAPKPLIETGKSRFPYDAVIRRLQELDTSLTIQMQKDEYSYGNLLQIRKYCQAKKFGYIKWQMDPDKSVRIWLNK